MSLNEELNKIIYDYGVIKWNEGFAYGCIFSCFLFIGTNLLLKIIKK
jgi:hypothetical protein